MAQFYQTTIFYLNAKNDLGSAAGLFKYGRTKLISIVLMTERGIFTQMIFVKLEDLKLKIKWASSSVQQEHMTVTLTRGKISL